MSEDLSTKFPNPPELQPIPSTQPRIWQTASLILIIGGLALLGTGGWMFYQNQLEASKPPPARILEPSLADDDVAALKSQPNPANIEPTAKTPPVKGDALAAEDDNSLTAKPTLAQQVNPVEAPDLAGGSDLLEEAVPTKDVDPVEEAALEEKITPEEATMPQEDTAAVAEAKLLEESALAQEGTLTSEPATDTRLSLADNPLVVAEAEIDAAGADLPAGSPPTRIVAENINLDAEIVEVGWQEVIRDGVPTNVWVVADYAAGWHKNSMPPGQGGNTVLSGHHNIKGEVFRYLVEIEVGATITLYVGDQRYDYAVDDKFIVKDKGEPEAVRRANARWIGPFNEERLTLVTCWPYNNNTHRVIVIAKPV